MNTCHHPDVRCLNEYELIRKYRCEDCGAVMMCSCDESRGRRFLPHQLNLGVELETQRRVPVTLGFQASVCRECRGLPPIAAPVAPTHGRTTKIQRYYWRELFFETMERFAAWAEPRGIPVDYGMSPEFAGVRTQIEREVLEHLKQLHAASPKYASQEESQDQVLRKYGVEVVRLDGIYAKGSDAKRVAILDGEKPYGAEEFAQRHFHRNGFKTLFLESSPFHVLFGVYMWPLLHSPFDPLVRMVAFGDRVSFEEGGPGRQIWIPLPEDFGTPGYGQRREREIDEHLSPEMHDRQELKRRFDR